MVHIVFDEEIGITNEPKNKGWKKKPLQFVEPKELRKKSAIGKKSFNYKENSMMTKCDGMWVKKEFVEEYDKLKSSLEGQLLEPKEVSLADFSSVYCRGYAEGIFSSVLVQE